MVSHVVLARTMENIAASHADEGEIEHVACPKSDLQAATVRHELQVGLASTKTADRQGRILDGARGTAHHLLASPAFSTP